MAHMPEGEPAQRGHFGMSVKPEPARGFDEQSVPAAWLKAAAPADLEEQVDRLEADLEWVNDLALRGFSGAQWDYFVHELAKYGMAVIGGWMYTGTIYEKCKHKGLGALPPMDRRFERDEIDELTGETVAKALYHFRVDILMKKKWDYRKGASLRTYFVGQCLIRYANVYRRWLGNESRNRHRLEANHLLLDAARKAPAESAGELAVDRVMAEEALSVIKNERVRKAMILTAAGRTQAEIAIQLEVTEKTVERMLANQRARFRRRPA